jgi:hypothetical protein
MSDESTESEPGSSSSASRRWAWFALLWVGSLGAWLLIAWVLKALMGLGMPDV